MLDQRTGIRGEQNKSVEPQVGREQTQILPQENAKIAKKTVFALFAFCCGSIEKNFKLQTQELKTLRMDISTFGNKLRRLAYRRFERIFCLGQEFFGLLKDAVCSSCLPAGGSDRALKTVGLFGAWTYPNSIRLVQMERELHNIFRPFGTFLLGARTQR
jgi:hypothetical protein